MVLCQIPTISPSNPGGGGVGEWGMPLHDRCISLLCKGGSEDCHRAPSKVSLCVHVPGGRICSIHCCGGGADMLQQTPELDG